MMILLPSVSHCLNVALCTSNPLDGTNSIIGPPFSTAEERGRRHVGYNTQTQYSASDLLQAHDEKVRSSRKELC